MADTSINAENTAADTSGATEDRPSRKVREGIVTSSSMDKTVTVSFVQQVRHRAYDKAVRRTKRLYVHDEENTLNVGDRIRVVETRPLSKNKRWRLLEILERAR